MVILDTSIINVALPSIGRDLHVTGPDLQWVVTSYTLTFAGFLLLGGRAADTLGQRRVLLVGVAVFTAASVAGGLAHSATWLVLARGAQGVGGAIMAPTTLAILTTHLRDTSRRARALSISGGIASASAATGAAMGGLLTQWANWRWILFLHAPFGAVVFCLGWRLLTDADNRPHWRRLDPLGAVLITVSLLAVVYGVVNTDRSGWLSVRTTGALVGGLVLLLLFVLYEARLARAPLLPLSLFRARHVAGANLAMFFLGGATFSNAYLLSMFIQNALGFSPARTGLAFLPLSAMTITGAYVGSRLLVRVGLSRLLLAGAALAVGGLLTLSANTEHANYFPRLILPAMAAVLGLSLCLTPIIVVATTVRSDIAGLAAGVVQVARQMGVALSVAALATLAAAGGTARGRQVTRSLLATGYAHAFLAAAMLALTGCVIGLAVHRRPPE